MFKNLHDWPKGAKFLAWIAFAVAGMAVWSFLASLTFLAGTRMLDLDKQWPLFEFWRYSHYYGFNHPVVGFWLKTSAIVATVIPTVIGVLLLMRNGLPKHSRALHGETRWSTLEERLKNEFYAKEQGIILGRDSRGKIIKLGGDGHVLVTAPTRTGKGVGVVVPNCLLFQGSIVVLDPKRENFDFTAGIRAAHGQKTYLFDPLSTSGQTHRYNPFTYVRRGTVEAYDDIQRIAQMIYPNVSGDQAFWNDSARSAFYGIATYLMETPERKFTIGEVYSCLARPSAVPVIKAQIKARRASGKPYSASCVQALDDYLNGGEDLVNSIRKSATAKLSLWNNPRVVAATEESDFDFRTLRRSLQAIYVGVDPNQIEQLRPLLVLFFQQLVDVNVQQLPRNDASLKHKVMLMLDEVALLKDMPAIADAFAFIAGYNIRIVMITQSHGQLRDPKCYGPERANTIRENCSAELTFGVKGLKAAEELSGELGYNTVVSTSKSGAALFRAFNLNRLSTTQSDQKRALLLPQEILRLKPTEAIVSVAGMFPTLAKRIRFFEEEPFKSLIAPRPDVPTIEVTIPLDQGEGEPPAPPETDEHDAVDAHDLTKPFETVEDEEADTQSAVDDADVIEPPMMPHRADSLMTSILGTKVDLSQYGLEDGKAAVAAIVDGLPTVATARKVRIAAE